MPSHMNCCFINCANSSRSTMNTAFHKFPADETLCKEWVEVCRNEKVFKKFEKHGSVQVSKSYRLCSEHFKREDYVKWTDKRKVLHKGTIPSGRQIRQTNTINEYSRTDMITEKDEAAEAAQDLSSIMDFDRPDYATEENDAVAAITDITVWNRHTDPYVQLISSDEDEAVALIGSSTPTVATNVDQSSTGIVEDERVSHPGNWSPSTTTDFDPSGSVSLCHEDNKVDADNTVWSPPPATNFNQSVTVTIEDQTVSSIGSWSPPATTYFNLLGIVNEAAADSTVWSPPTATNFDLSDAISEDDETVTNIVTAWSPPAAINIDLSLSETAEDEAVANWSSSTTTDFDQSGSIAIKDELVSSIASWSPPDTTDFDSSNTVVNNVGWSPPTTTNFDTSSTVFHQDN